MSIIALLTLQQANQQVGQTTGDILNFISNKQENKDITEEQRNALNLRNNEDKQRFALLNLQVGAASADFQKQLALQKAVYNASLQSQQRLSAFNALREQDITQNYLAYKLSGAPFRTIPTQVTDRLGHNLVEATKNS